jgi:hypothetical protein
MIEPSTSFEKADRRRCDRLVAALQPVEREHRGNRHDRGRCAVMMSASPTGPATVPIDA